MFASNLIRISFHLSKLVNQDFENRILVLNRIY